jgi:ATP-dependent DNA ligase
MKGYDFTDRYPRIVEAARKIRRTSFAVDGEAVVLGVDGISDSMPSGRAITTKRYSSARSIPVGGRRGSPEIAVASL